MSDSQDKLSEDVAQLSQNIQNNNQILIQKLDEIKQRNYEQSQITNFIYKIPYELIEGLNKIIQQLKSNVDNICTDSVIESKLNFGTILDSLFHMGINNLIPNSDNIITQIIRREFSEISINRLLGFSSGGEIPVNTPVLVGEHGPEVFISKSAGQIIPNSQIQTSNNNKHNNITINFNIAVQKSENIIQEIQALMPEIVYTIEDKIIQNLQWKFIN